MALRVPRAAPPGSIIMGKKMVRRVVTPAVIADNLQHIGKVLAEHKN